VYFLLVGLKIECLLYHILPSKWAGKATDGNRRLSTDGNRQQSTAIDNKTIALKINAKLINQW